MKKITLEELVDRMLSEQNHNPRDQCFRFVVNNYPKAVHDAFDFPGEYVKKLGLDILTDDNRKLGMDCAQLIMPKGDITCKSTINVEHQTYPIEDKVDAIYDYKIGLIHQNNIPSNSIIMTNMDLGEENILCKSHDQIFNLKINRVTIEEISKRLKILNDKIENNQKLSLNELMYFAYIAIFVDENHAKDTMEKLSLLFAEIGQIDFTVELDLHQILKSMIKFHFRDDEDFCKEMLIMISKSLYSNDYEGLTYKERSELQIKELNQLLDETSQQLDERNQQLDEKDLQIEHLLEENKKLKGLNGMK